MLSRESGAHVDRAKQFVPFAALRGYYEMVADVSRYREDRRSLLPDRQEELDAALQELEPGDTLMVRHHRGDVYVTTTGKLVEVREDDGVLVVDELSIRAEDVFDIECVLPDAEL